MLVFTKKEDKLATKDVPTMLCSFEHQRCTLAGIVGFPNVNQHNIEETLYIPFPHLEINPA